MGMLIFHQPHARGGKPHKRYGNKLINMDSGMLGCTGYTAMDSG